MELIIAVVGLEREGISAALALKQVHADMRCRGWDADARKRAAAEDSQAFDAVKPHLKDALKDAAIVLLHLPPQALAPLLPEIREALPSAAFLINMCGMQASVTEAVANVLGKTARLASLFPAINPQLLTAGAFDSERATPDLFAGGTAFISAPTWVEAIVLDVAVDLAVLLGCLPVFADEHEVQGLLAAVELLPSLAVHNLMALLSAQGGWRDGRMLAGVSLARATVALQDISPESAAQLALAGRENLIWLLDALMEQMRKTRQSLLDADEEALRTAIQDSQSERERWLADRLKNKRERDLTSSFPGRDEALRHVMQFAR